MPKVKLTEELSNALKNTRNDKNIKAADLAKEIGKSLAFISKLENNVAEQVDLPVLVAIFKFLIGEEFMDFINPLLEKATIELTPEEIKKQEWVNIFDLEYRKIPIPTSLVEFINTELERLSLTPDQVILEMNKNEELTDKDMLGQNKNSLIFSKGKETSDSYSYIIFELEDSFLTKILSTEKTTINYITMEGILRTIYKIEGLSVDDAHNRTVAALNKNKFYSLSEKKKLLRLNKRKEDMDDVLTDFDKANRQTVNSILKNIMMLSEWDIDYTNKKLKNLDDSFSIDPPFIMAVIGSNFFKLKDVKKETKKLFLSELDKLIDKFSNITPEPEQDFEKY